MKLYSYIVSRDYGFAPNPFFGVCTLATCKPKIRCVAEIDDWVVGTGAKSNKRDGNLVYAMKICDTMSYNCYWKKLEYRDKRPKLNGSIKRAYGDNIYHQNKAGNWEQEDSHHSYENGIVNEANLLHDTKTDRVLISKYFVYFGGDGPEIPANLNDIVHKTQGHKIIECECTLKLFLEWIHGLDRCGCCGKPTNWK